MTSNAWSVAGQRVVVVGGGRSGLAAAELLVARGARVTLSDTAASVPGADRLRDLGVTVELGPHRAETLGRADLLVGQGHFGLQQHQGARAEPGRPPT